MPDNEIVIENETEAKKHAALLMKRTMHAATTNMLLSACQTIELANTFIARAGVIDCAATLNIVNNIKSAVAATDAKLLEIANNEGQLQLLDS